VDTVTRASSAQGVDVGVDGEEVEGTAVAVVVAGGAVVVAPGAVVAGAGDDADSRLGRRNHTRDAVTTTIAAATITAVRTSRRGRGGL
jgi:hypothetical protein